ncbi:hypothetical protein BU24DRAFT_463035 [Aaosphaeria arxii CBS 175.79]|uniref:Uncharacterized protein n=1 Tax=Aaosphaeria arxii CBS 175.79 TaxID=1450172 RepID=A0A6A5XN00_9PLEO|nr:uncharacterized protein BU24DRAFT_463035 [Aaosphaeria arxii CBS 175.79]KAF2014227.1 hypothetical protein BU24DRAFT_463035 [Aaosphaeria arxii CBS 175.79]
MTTNTPPITWGHELLIKPPNKTKRQLTETICRNAISEDLRFQQYAEMSIWVCLHTSKDPVLHITVRLKTSQQLLNGRQFVAHIYRPCEDMPPQIFGEDRDDEARSRRPRRHRYRRNRNAQQYR